MQIAVEKRVLNQAELEARVRDILELLGEDPEREGLKETPHRVAQTLAFFTQGHKQDLKKIINGAVFESDVDEMVILKDIDFASLCEHHLLPFYGKCHIAYLPKGRILGLSKLARIVEFYSRRLQVQEHLTKQVANTLNDVLRPKGVGVIIEGYHLCMAIRGVLKQNSLCKTSAMLGRFKTDPRTRSEFLALVNLNK